MSRSLVRAFGVALATVLTVGTGVPAATAAPAESLPGAAVDLNLLSLSVQADAVPPTPAPKARAVEVPVPAAPAARSGASSAQRQATARRVVSSAVGDLAVVGVTWQTGAADRTVSLQMRSRTGSTWTAWEDMEVAPTPVGAPNPKHRSGSDAVTVTGADEVQVALTSSNGTPVTGAALTVVDPGQWSGDALPRRTSEGHIGPVSATPETAPETPTLSSELAPAGPATVSAAVDRSTPAQAGLAQQTATAESVPPGMPWVYTRAAWGADESITSWPAWRMSHTKAIVVHHTAGTNFYTAAQVPGLLRGIHYFHAVTRGWGDIGYNILVDQFGRAWQGRVGGPFSPNLGGHAAPNNEETMGVSMLGNYQEAQPPAAAVSAVSAVSAYQLSLSGIRADQWVSIRDSKGLYHSYPAVTTHRDVAAYGPLPTGCPGQYMIAKMPSLRSLTLSRQAGLVPGVHRLKGTTPSQKSFEISQAVNMPWEDVAWSDPGDVSDGVDALVIAPAGATYTQHAILGANLAMRWDSPLLTVNGGAVTSNLINEVKRLKPHRVFVVGTSGMVSDAAASEIYSAARSVYPQATLRRAGGVTPNDTALAMRSLWPSRSSIVYLADSSQLGWWAGLPQAARADGSQIFLTNKGIHPVATTVALRALKPSQVRVVGPKSVYSDAWLAWLRTQIPGISVNRYVRGETHDSQNSMYARVATSWKPASHAHFVRWTDLSMIAPALAASRGSEGPVIFTSPKCVSTFQQWVLRDFTRPAVRHAYSWQDYSAGNPLTRTC